MFFHNFNFVFVVKLHCIEKITGKVVSWSTTFFNQIGLNVWAFCNVTVATATNVNRRGPSNAWTYHKSTTLRHKMHTIRLVVYDCHSGVCIIVWTQHNSCLWFHYECWKTYLHTCTLNHIHLDDIRMRQLYRVDNS